LYVSTNVNFTPPLEIPEIEKKQRCIVNTFLFKKKVFFFVALGPFQLIWISFSSISGISNGGVKFTFVETYKYLYPYPKRGETNVK